MNEKLLPGRIAISRPHPGDYISISIEDESSGVQFIEVRVKYATFTQVLTGSRGKCEFEVRGLELIGKRREHKEIQIYVPDSDFSDRERTARKAVESHEDCGWKGRVEDALNHHRVVKRDSDGALYRVTFVRYVDDEQCSQS